MKKLNVPEIMKFHKNRYPWFFVDRVMIKASGMVVGYKNFTCNEWFVLSINNCIKFGLCKPVIPEFIIGEVLEQTFLMTFMTENPILATTTVSSEMSYERQIFLGERMEIRAELASFRRGMAKGIALGFIDEECVCRGSFMVAVPEIMKKFIPVF